MVSTEKLSIDQEPTLLWCAMYLSPGTFQKRFNSYHYCCSFSSCLTVSNNCHLSCWLSSRDMTAMRSCHPHLLSDVALKRVSSETARQFYGKLRDNEWIMPFIHHIPRTFFLLFPKFQFIAVNMGPHRSKNFKTFRNGNFQKPLLPQFSSDINYFITLDGVRFHSEAKPPLVIQSHLVVWKLPPIMNDYRFRAFSLIVWTFSRQTVLHSVYRNKKSQKDFQKASRKSVTNCGSLATISTDFHYQDKYGNHDRILAFRFLCDQPITV